MTVQMAPNGVPDVRRRRVRGAYGAAARPANHQRFAAVAAVLRAVQECMFRATAVWPTNAAGPRRNVQIPERLATNRHAAAVYGDRRAPVRAVIRATAVEQTAALA